MKKVLIFLLIISTFLLTPTILQAATYTDEQLPTNLITNPFATKSWNNAYAEDYWLMYSNYNFYDDGLAVYFPDSDEDNDHLWYTIAANPPTTYIKAGIEFYDSSYNLIEFIAFEDVDGYVSDVYGAWYGFETDTVGVTYFRTKMLYAGDSSYGSDMQAQTLIAPLWVSQASTFMFWYLDTLGDVQEGYYNAGYNDGQDDIFENGSNDYGYDEKDSFDYGEGYFFGYIDGGAKNVNSGLTSFMEDFGTWITPAILLVILIGGYFAVRKGQGE